MEFHYHKPPQEFDMPPQYFSSNFGTNPSLVSVYSEELISTGGKIVRRCGDLSELGILEGWFRSLHCNNFQFAYHKVVLITPRKKIFASSLAFVVIYCFFIRLLVGIKGVQISPVSFVFAITK